MTGVFGTVVNIITRGGDNYRFALPCCPAVAVGRSPVGWCTVHVDTLDRSIIPVFNYQICYIYILFVFAEQARVCEQHHCAQKQTDLSSSPSSCSTQQTNQNFLWPYERCLDLAARTVRMPSATITKNTVRT